MMLDLEPAVYVLIELVEGVRDDQLMAPTPCREASLGDLIDHLSGFSTTFAAAATKTPLDDGTPGPSADATKLGANWRVRIPNGLMVLADSWGRESAWTGMTQAGGLDLPAEMAGAIALDEVIVHGWDIAIGSGRSFHCEQHLVQAAYEFVQATVAGSPQGSPGMFGPPVPMPDEAPLLERLIALTGRNPDWSP